MIQLIQPLGDVAILLTFGSQINTDTNNEIVNYVHSLKKVKIDGVLEIIPAYVTITIQYDFFKISYKELKEKLESLVVAEVDTRQTKTIKIPVCYDTSLSKDLKEVMSYTGMSKEEIILTHTSKDYLVYMLGFMPGFFYLGGMDTRLFCPRKEKPRLKIEAGSVGIAGEQTGVYSLDSPGGWQIIGKTPLLVFDKNRKENFFLVNQGDTIRFYEISYEEFKQYQK
jgi:inhibitor of KinA